MTKSKISWTERVWNPITGCSKISEGCANCYAERMTFRLAKMHSKKYKHGFEVTCHPEELDKPFKWKPSRIFVCSMSDWMHEYVDTEFAQKIFNVMTDCPKHLFMTLTKRPINLRLAWLQALSQTDASFFSHVWFGVSIENQIMANIRANKFLALRQTNNTFLSIEPMLTPIKLGRRESIASWIILGCESGPKARPMQLRWAYDILDYCNDNHIPLFIKQLTIKGKCSREPEEWPQELRVQNYPPSITSFIKEKKHVKKD